MQVIMQVTEIDPALVALGSYFDNNHTFQYSVQILTSLNDEVLKPIKDLLARFQVKASFTNGELLETIGSILPEPVIILNEKSLTLKPVEPLFKYFLKYEMVGHCRYQLKHIFPQVPVVDGIFADGWMVLNKVRFTPVYIKMFSKTFKIPREHPLFDLVFLSWLCRFKLQTPNIGNESSFFHYDRIDDLKIINFCKNPGNAFPWKKSKIKIYLFYYIKQYFLFAQKYGCSEETLKIIKWNFRFELFKREFEEDLKDKFTFISWHRVFIPFSERVRINRI